MTNAEALEIIEGLRGEAPHYNFGLLEILEIMTDELEAGGHQYFVEVYTPKERSAYFILMAGFRKMFFSQAKKSA